MPSKERKARDKLQRAVDRHDKKWSETSDEEIAAIFPDGVKLMKGFNPHILSFPKSGKQDSFKIWEYPQRTFSKSFFLANEFWYENWCGPLPCSGCGKPAKTLFVPSMRHFKRALCGNCLAPLIILKSLEDD